MLKKILLHICCGPCVVGIIEELKKDYEVVAYFYNPNIYPESEYKLRKEESERACKEYGVEFIEGEYDQGNWDKAVVGLEQEPEGGARCSVCFKFRLENTAKYAKEHGFEIYASTLTSGRNKKEDIINPIGCAMGDKYGVSFLEEDWKKKGRQEKGCEICRQKNIYRQDYCGCKYSM